MKKKQEMTIGQEDNTRDGVGCERHVVELCKALQKLRSWWSFSNYIFSNAVILSFIKCWREKLSCPSLLHKPIPWSWFTAVARGLFQKVA